MPDNSSSLLSFLPFQDLDTNDFLKLEAPGFISLLIGFQKKLDLYQDIIESPDRDEPLKCLQEASIESIYCTIKKSDRLFMMQLSKTDFLCFTVILEVWGK